MEVQSGGNTNKRENFPSCFARYHLSFKNKGKGYENPNLVLHDPDGGQHPDGSHRQGAVGSSPDGRVNP